MYGEDSMLNKVQVIGRLGRDPELKYTQSGAPVTTLNIATDENYTDREGNKVERTEWHRVAVFQRSAENCAQFLAKGSLVYVEGKLTTRKWQDPQGQDRYTTEIRADRVQFLDRKSDRAGAGDDSFSAPAKSQAPSTKKNASQGSDENYGSPFPSEASDMDDTPF